MGMERYKNLSGASGVRSYEIGDGRIIIKFNTGVRYKYNSIKPGLAHVNRMIELARKGRGLNSYINKNVKRNCYRLG